MEGLDSCSICMDTFDDNLRPRTLPCGHTFCTGCINNALKNGSLDCPNCKRTHRASRAEDFPISYITESLIAKLRESQQGAIPKQPSQPEKQSLNSRSMKSRAKSVIKDQEESLKGLLELCEPVRLDIIKYQTFLRERKANHQELISKISDLLCQHQEMVKRLDAEDKKSAEMLKNGDEHHNVVKSKLSKLLNITKTADLEATSEELEMAFDTLESWYEQCQTQMPDTETIRRSGKVIRETTTALDRLGKVEHEAVLDTIDLSNPGKTLMDKVMLLEKTPVSLKILQDMSERAKSVIKSHRIYAVQKKEGRVRSAKISYQDGKTYLHCLQDCAPPANVYTVEQSELLGTLNTDAILVFLDLAWGQEIRGRVHILLSPDTPLARHFKALCTGELGPTYAQTRFLEVIDEGGDFERVLAGDYENNDGSGRAPLFTGLFPSDDIYHRPYTEGSVSVVYLNSEGPKISQFDIATRGMKDIFFRGVFAQVQDGLDVVTEAIKLDDIRNVIIQDCGVVLPM